jgi:hypothetical protein
VIVAFYRYEWFLADLGAIFAGGKAAGVYTTNGPEACEYIASHSEAVVIIVEDEKQMAKFVDIRDNLTACLAFVQYRGEISDEVKVGVIKLGSLTPLSFSFPFLTFLYLPNQRPGEGRCNQARFSQSFHYVPNAIISNTHSSFPPFLFFLFLT